MGRVTQFNKIPTLGKDGPTQDEFNRLQDRLVEALRVVRQSPQALLDAKGSLVTASAPGAPVEHLVGSDSQVLSADSTQTTGLTWKAGNPFVNVIDFGAKGDGKADDSAAIQKAVLSAAGGKIVVLPPVGNGQTVYLIGSTTLAVAAGADTGLLGGGAPGGVIIKYTGTGDAIKWGDSTADTSNMLIRNLGLDLGSAGSGANALNTVRVTGGALENVQITGRTSAPDLGVGIILDGTGNYSGNIVFTKVSITGNYTKGIHCKGAAALDTCNHHTFNNLIIARTTTVPGTGTIGFHYGVNAGDGMALVPDVEGYDIGFQIDGGFLQGFIRAEANTTAVAFGAASNSNFLTIAQFANTNLATYAGGQAFNTLIDTIGFQSNIQGLGTLLLRRNADSDVFLDLESGVAAEQNAGFRFLNKSGVPVWRLVKSPFNLSVDDGTTTMIVFNPGTGGPTQFKVPVQMQSSFSLATPAFASQAGAIYQGSGVPSNTNGNDGDFYFRTDTPATVTQRLYNKQAGTWTGIL